MTKIPEPPFWQIFRPLNLFLTSLIVANGLGFFGYAQTPPSPNGTNPINPMNSGAPQNPVGQKQDFAVRAECLDAKATGIQSDPKLAGYNFHCDHEWALRNGNSINYVHQLYVERKHSNVRAALENSSDPSPFFADGTCIKNVRDPRTNMVHDETLQECEERLRRAVLDSKVQNRERTLEYNKARGELLDERGVDLQNTNAVRATQESPKNSILNDLYRFSRLGPDGKPITAPVDGAPVAPASNSGDNNAPAKSSIAGGVELRAVDRSAIGEDSRKRMGINSDSLEVQGEQVEKNLNEKLQKVVKQKGSFSKANFEKDHQKMIAVEEKLKMAPQLTPGQDPAFQATDSARTFNDIMNRIDAEAKKDSELPKGLAEPGAKQVSASPRISPTVPAPGGAPSGGSKKSGGLDKDISELIDPLLSQ